MKLTMVATDGEMNWGIRNGQKHYYYYYYSNHVHRSLKKRWGAREGEGGRKNNLPTAQLDTAALLGVNIICSGFGNRQTSIIGHFCSEGVSE